MKSQTFFSVIICSIDAMKFARVSENYERLLAGVPHEIIGIHDAMSLAEGYNRGMARAVGDIFVFSHDDILILDPGFAGKISDRLQTWDILGVAGTDRMGWPFQHGLIAYGKPGIPHLKLDVFGVSDWPVIGDIQAIDGVLMTATRETAQAIGFDAEIFDGFHFYDLDFSFSAYLAGRKLGVCCDIPVIHESAGDYGQQYKKYSERFLQKHRDRLDELPGNIGNPGRAAHFSDHHALLAVWQEDVLKRVNLGISRQSAEMPTTSPQPAP